MLSADNILSNFFMNPPRHPCHGIFAAIRAHYFDVCVFGDMFLICTSDDFIIKSTKQAEDASAVVALLIPDSLTEVKLMMRRQYKCRALAGGKR